VLEQLGCATRGRWITIRICGVPFLPCSPATFEDFEIVKTVVILIVKLLRHTGAFIFGRSLAVSHHQAILGDLGDKTVNISFGH
jgi:hypothetical protein